MSPRPYQLGRRREQIDESRRRILAAARALLAETASYSAFTVDAVARRADVARATVYYQFESKTGLLEALCDALADDAGQLAGISAAMTSPDVGDAVAGVVAAFGRLWAVDRPAMRRLRAFGVLDPEVGAVVAARDQRRLHLAGVLVGRSGAAAGDSPVGDAETLARALWTLTSFETFDTLAGDRPLTDVTPVVAALAAAVLGG